MVLTGNYIGKGKLTSLDKYGKVTCEEVCWTYKIHKTCDKRVFYLESGHDKIYNALLNQDSSNVLKGQDGDYKHMEIIIDSSELKLSFTSFNLKKQVHYNGFLTLKKCKCVNEDACSCNHYIKE